MIADTKSLAKNIKNDVDEFEITVDLKNQVIKFKVRTSRISKWAWGLAVVSIGSAVALYLVTPAATVSTAGTGGVISFGSATVAGAGAITILGISVTTFAISLGVAAGGVGVITKLKDRYDVIERNGRYFMKKR